MWFLTGSQHLYGEETLRQVHEHSRQLAQALNDSPAIPLAIVDREPLTDADAIRRVLAEASVDDECVGVIAWMHTFSPARMWIGGLDALRKPLLHLHTQFDRELPWGQIDMDYMNLNQSAHGDREFAYIETRMGISRKTVVGHWSDRLVQERIGIWVRAACGWQEAQRVHDRPVRRQHARRRGHRGRQGRRPDHPRRHRQRLRRRRPVRRGRRTRARRPSPSCSSATTTSTTSCQSCGPTARAASRSCRRRRSRWACARSCSTVAIGAFTDTFEDLGRCASSRASPCSG